MKINFVVTIRKENMKMIKGIEVLATNNIYTCADWCSIGFEVSLIIAILLFLLILLCNVDVPYIMGICEISFICAVIFALCMGYNHSKLDHVEYQVTISDDVPAVEFNSKYEIVNQNGKIYTIKEKEN